MPPTQRYILENFRAKVESFKGEEELRNKNVHTLNFKLASVFPQQYPVLDGSGTMNIHF